MKKTHIFSCFFILTVCLFFCSNTLAQTSIVTGSTQTMGKTLVVLLGVVGLIIGLAWLSKIFGVNNLIAHKDIKAIAQIPLGQREKAVLIDVYGKKILLGVSPGNVNTLHVFDSITPESAATNHTYKTHASPQSEATDDDAKYKRLLPREYNDDFPVPLTKSDDLTSSNKTAKESSEFSCFLKKIMSNGNVNR